MALKPEMIADELSFLRALSRTVANCAVDKTSYGCSILHSATAERHSAFNGLKGPHIIWLTQMTCVGFETVQNNVIHVTEFGSVKC